MDGTAQLGNKYRDTLTGFEGTATGRTEYLYGCVRVLLEGAGSDRKPEDFWFDEQRLIEVGAERPVETNATSGGPSPAPPSRDPR